MIKVKLIEDCTTYSLDTDSTLSFREILMQFVHTAKDHEIIIFLEDVIALCGTWETMGYCEKCNDTYGEYTLEIKDTND